MQLELLLLGEMKIFELKLNDFSKAKPNQITEAIIRADSEERAREIAMSFAEGRESFQV